MLDLSSIPLPAPTRARVVELVRRRDELTAVIDATLQASREALNVPDGWIIRSAEEGFIPPGGSNGNGAEPAQGPARAYGGDAQTEGNA